MGKIVRPLIRRMRIANAAIFPLLLLSGIIHDIDNWPGIVAEFILSSGLAVLLSPFYLAWRGLAPYSTLHMVRRARIASIVLGGLMALMHIVLIVEASEKSTSLVELLPVLLFPLFAPVTCVLNIKALAQRKAELDQTNANQSPECLET